MFRQDPGLCPICDAPHCGCAPAGARPDTIVLLSQRDAMLEDARPVELHTQTLEPPVELAPPLEPEPQPFSTAEYKRAIHGRKARR